MGIRDEEINRLKKYAEGLGIKVLFKENCKHNYAADWDMDDRIITIYTKNNESKTDIILSFIHELGHHMDWIYNNKKHSKKSQKAFEMLNDETRKKKIPKSYRWIILNEELAGIHYMDIIHKELDLKIPLWKVKMQQALDAFQYKTFYKEGRFATEQEYMEYKRSIKEYYKERYNE